MGSVLALALASYLSLYPALLLPPLLLLCYDRLAPDRKFASNIPMFYGTYISVFFGSIAWLLYISSVLTGGSWEFLSSTYGVHLLLPDLTPNVGLWWYFFIEIFDSFREFFLAVFWLHLGGYVGGLCLRVRKQPLFIITTLLGIFAVFKPYPTVSDASLYFALLPLYRHTFPCNISRTNFPSHLTLISYSDAIYVFRHGDNCVRHFARTGLLLPLDICRFRKRQLLLCHYPRLEPWTVRNRSRFAICRPQR